MSGGPDLDRSVFEARRRRLKSVLRRHGLPGLLVSHAANRFYLSGFELHDAQCNESSGWLVVSADNRDYLFTDPRFEDAAARVWNREAVIVYTDKKHSLVGSLLKGQGQAELAFESRSLNFRDHQELSKHLRLQPSEGLVEGLRMVKDQEELRRIEASCALNHRVLRDIESRLTPGRSEAEIAWEIERLFREAGASELAFAPIVAVDANAALPHAVPGDAVIREGSLVLVDIGGRYLDYCSDQTRTFWVGARPPDRFLKTLEQVKTAQKKALSILRPGLPAADAFRAARAYFEEQGVAARFTHSLGHGVGLETHEPPSLGQRSKAGLKTGMIITLEPGLYFPGWGGVRWEHMVLITSDGARLL